MKNYLRQIGSFHYYQQYSHLVRLVPMAFDSRSFVLLKTKSKFAC